MHKEELHDLSTSLNIFFKWRNRPRGPRPPHNRGFLIILNLDTPHWEGLLRTSDQPVAETST